MSRTNPIRRPALARSQPIRNFAGVFGARKPAPAAQATQAATNGKPTRTAGEKNGAGGAGKNGAAKKPAADPGAAVARGVNAGYRVIEEYLRQGQDFARTLWPGSASAGGGTPDAPMNMTERLIRSASDLAGLFSEFLQTFSLPGHLPPPGSTPIPDFGIDRTAAGSAATAGTASATRARGSAGTPPVTNGAADSARTNNGATAAAGPDAPAVISVDLHSRRRAQVTVYARPDAWSSGLHVHDLRLKEGPARLGGVTATGIAADRRVVVTANIPDDLPPGTYSGLIVDAETNLPRGTISVRIFPAEANRTTTPGKPAKSTKAMARKAARASR